MVFNSFAAGRKVYGQGSYAPTRGHVSAQGAKGYLQREIKKPNRPLGGVSSFGRDGQSDTRSGAAATMLSRNTKGSSNGGSKLPTNNAPTNSGSGGVRQAPTPDGGPRQGSMDPVGGPVVPPPPPPTVEIGADGTLSLPYSSEWSDNVINGLQNMNSQLMDLQFGAQEQAMQYSRANRDADLAYDDAKRGTLGANATGGTAFSSQYGKSVGDNAKAYGNFKNDLLMDDNMFKIKTDHQRLGIQNAFNNMLRQDVIKLGQNPIAPPKVPLPPVSAPPVVSPPKDNKGGGKGGGKDNKNNKNKNNNNNKNNNKNDKNKKQGTAQNAAKAYLNGKKKK